MTNMKSRLRKGAPSQILPNIVLMLITFCMLYPFCVLVASSFTAEGSLSRNGYKLIPGQVTLDAYKTLLESPKQILEAYGITIFVTVVGTAVGVVMMLGLAYAMYRPDFKYRGVLSVFIYITMVFNGGMIPTYIVYVRYYDLMNRVSALILPMLVNVFNVFLLRTFMAQTPYSLVESAKIDGASDIAIFFRICLPLMKAGIVIVGLFTALAFWNDWWHNFLYIQDNSVVNLQYMLQRTMTQSNMLKQYPEMRELVESAADLPNKNLRMATCVLAAGPMTIAFCFLQKYFVKGVAIGSVKG
jgi:putative aldouronate transport system permease protein